MEYTEREINNLRQKLVDYYGSAAPFFGAAMVDVIRVEQMSDEEITEAAKRLQLN